MPLKTCIHLFLVHLLLLSQAFATRFPANHTAFDTLAPPLNSAHSSSSFPLDPRFPFVPYQHLTTSPAIHNSALSFRECSHLHYRSLSGRCTSSKKASWGQARLAQFSYFPRSTSVRPTGSNLRSAREVSNILSAQSANTVNKHGLNELFTFFGQFLDHNLVATPENKRDPLDIDVPASDSRLSARKLPFKRSVRRATGFGRSRRPINILSSAVDLVAVYGPNPFRNRALLEFNHKRVMTGKLKTSRDGLMPLNTAGLRNSPDSSARFFLAGDHRANENPALLAMHTLFVREHNRLVDEIKKKIPLLKPQQLYELARKLNIAQFQKIVYEEFYPAILSRGLPPYRGFQPTVNPTVSDIFAGAAFRIGHTMVGMQIPRRGHRRQFRPREMNDMFFRPASSFSSVEMNNVIRGIAKSPAQEVDLKVVDLLRNFLFTNVRGETGFDLVALNIQRGRDHALPKFNQIRTLFGIPRAKDFGGISRNRRVADALSRAYGHVDNVEAFAGMLAEDHRAGDGMGFTMGAVWRAEFARLRDGDRHFYLNLKSYPDLLRDHMTDEVTILLRKSHGTLRDIITRNTATTRTHLSARNIFNLKG